MADERPRSVSGEIMAVGPSVPRHAPQDVLDADYEEVPPPAREATPRAPAPAAAIGSVEAPLAGLGTLRGGAGRPSTGSRRAGPLFWATGVVLIVGAFWVSGGHALVRAAVPVAEAPVRALQLAGVRSRVDMSGARPVLFVDGEAANSGTTVETLPPLDIAVTANDGRVTRYKLGTAERPLAPGERFAFSSRLEVPSDGVRNVTVSFSE